VQSILVSNLPAPSNIRKLTIITGSDLYAPPTPDSDKSSTLSKLKNKLSKKGNGDKGKGKENIGGS
jgi:hypothetical protein